ncbi:MAG: F0F1 ATP synthase subunit epsilon [Muribaculaceae bacterium]|nr:F0F1 ATP synthase subunit epsilon [Muribaculaceae bacterium]
MTLEIISAHAVLFRGEADAVTLPGAMGSFTVLKNHAPIIAVLSEGAVRYSSEENGENEIVVKGGLVDVIDNKVTVCVY